MKSLFLNFLFFALIAILSSCNGRFDKPMGDPLPEFPESVQGKHQLLPAKKGSTSDTMMVEITEKDLILHGKKWKDHLYYSDSVYMSQIEDWYFLNIRSNYQNVVAWDIYPLYFRKGTGYLFDFSEEKTIKKLKKFLEFEQMPKEKGGGVVFTLHENEFLRFCNKKLKRRKAIRMTPIQD
jgi:hypothetical protein